MGIHSIRRFGTDSELPRSTKRFFHYTSPEGLFAILQSRSLRFTDYRFLNDKSEFTYLYDMLRELLDSLALDQGPVGDFVRLLLTLARNNYTSEAMVIPPLTRESLGGLLENHNDRYYVFCASTDSDALPLWNYYVKNGHYEGYNLGFTVHRLMGCFENLSASLQWSDVFYGPVLYDAKKQRDELTRIIKAAAEIYREDKTDRALTAFVDDVNLTRMFCKNPIFSSECEYRIVVKAFQPESPAKTEPAPAEKNQLDPIRRGFTIKSSAFAPHLDIPFGPEIWPNSIAISPVLDYDFTKMGLREYLEYLQYPLKEIAIQQSHVPIRY